MRKSPAFLRKRRAFSRAEPFRILILRSAFLKGLGDFFKKKSPPKKEPLTRLLRDLNPAVFTFVVADALPHEEENLPADGTPVVLRDKAELRVGDGVDVEPQMFVFLQVLTTKTNFVLIMS